MSENLKRDAINMPRPKLKLKLKSKTEDDFSEDTIHIPMDDPKPRPSDLPDVETDTWKPALYAKNLFDWQSSSPSELCLAVKAYFDEVIDRRKRDTHYGDKGPVVPRYPFTHSGLVIHLGLMNKGELVELSNANSDFKAVMSKAFMLIEQDIVEGTLMNVYNPKMSSMYLTHCLSWLESSNKSKGKPNEVAPSGMKIQFISVGGRDDVKQIPQHVNITTDAPVEVERGDSNDL